MGIIKNWIVKLTIHKKLKNNNNNKIWINYNIILIQNIYIWKEITHLKITFNYIIFKLIINNIYIKKWYKKVKYKIVMLYFEGNKWRLNYYLIIYIIY